MRRRSRRLLEGAAELDLREISQCREFAESHGFLVVFLQEIRHQAQLEIGQPGPMAAEGLARYGAALGLAFQVVDDILDVTADSATLGKTAGKDAAQDKPTYVSLLGLERAGAYAAELLEQARAALAATGLADTRALRALAEMVVHREN